MHTGTTPYPEEHQLSLAIPSKPVRHFLNGAELRGRRLHRLWINPYAPFPLQVLLSAESFPEAVTPRPQ